MQQSIRSQTLPTQFSTNKLYFVKKKILQNIPKKKQNYFKSAYNQQQLIQHNPSSSLSQIKNVRTQFNRQKHNINSNRFQSIDSLTSADKYKSLVSLTQSRITNNYQQSISNQISKKIAQPNRKVNNQLQSLPLSRQKSYFSLLQSQNKPKIDKKYVFETIVDQNFKKRLKRHQILIKDDRQNPQNKYESLPKITSQNLKNNKKLVQYQQIQVSLKKYQQKGHQKTNLLTIQSQAKFSTNQSRSRLYEQTLDSYLKQIKNKSCIQKLNSYHNKWNFQKQRRNKQIFKQIKKDKKLNDNKYENTDILVYDRSLLQKSEQKSANIVKKFNVDSYLRGLKSNWVQQLRTGKKDFLTIGQPTSQIPKLKGQGNNQKFNVQVKPIYFMDTNKHICQEIYKLDK